MEAQYTILYKERRFRVEIATFALKKEVHKLKGQHDETFEITIDSSSGMGCRDICPNIDIKKIFQSEIIISRHLNVSAVWYLMPEIYETINRLFIFYHGQRIPIWLFDK